MKSVDINGTIKDIPAEVHNVSHLLEYLGLGERILIVELNGHILQKDAYDQPVQTKDKVEIIHFVGGG